VSQSDSIWEHYARDGGVFKSHNEPNYVTQQYIHHLEEECKRLRAEIDELRKQLGND
jgi:cob(I)alamin adenosyltransferase